MGRKRIYSGTETKRGIEASKLSNQSTRKKVIRAFHTLIKQKSLAEARGDCEKTSALDAKIKSLGGLETYQRASISGHSSSLNGSFNTSCWVIDYISQKSLFPKQKLLDVGALTNHYINYADSLETTAIDLNPWHESVKKLDFLDNECLMELSTPFDCIVLSLVLNFVPCKLKRGLMLKRANEVLKLGGTLFVVLPKSCIENSRYMDEACFVKILEGLGFTKRSKKTSPKLIFFAFECASKDIVDFMFTPQVIRKGSRRNNFAIKIDQNL